MTTMATVRLMATSEVPPPARYWGEGLVDMWPYRDRTIAMLRRYARLSVELGRLPSLLGREFFRSRVTSYRMANLEDVVAFVHDMERALDTLGAMERKLIAMNVIEEYSQEEIARLMHCSKRWVEMQVPEAIDSLSRTLIERGVIRKIPVQKSCQEGKTREFPVSGSKDGENIF